MSTHSMIGIQNEDGSVRAIYCHFDGHPRHHGPILLGFYNDRERANALIDLGSLRHLGADIGIKHNMRSEERPSMCVAYFRDGGESEIEIEEYDSRDEMLGDGYAYLFVDDQWLVASATGIWRPLQDVVNGL